MPEHLTEDSFIEKIFDFKNETEWKFKGNKPAIIDFYADWCGPCKLIAPILDQLDSEYEGKINIYKINTEKEQELSATFGIQSIPSILFIPIDDKPQMATGALPKKEFESMITEILKVQK